MVREIVISSYLFIFRTLFNVFSLLPLKKKSAFVASFEDNILYTIKEVEKQTIDRVVVLRTSKHKVPIQPAPDRIVLNFIPFNFFDWIRSIYHLATSHNVFVDNYYGLLAVTNFKPSVQCIQLWHAAGAIKQFGLKDLSIQNRSAKAYSRFKNVYQRFDHVVVGSEKMAIIFQEGFGLTEKQLLRTGVPRTDFFFDTAAKERMGNILIRNFPIIKVKKVILYAPTYRDEEINVSALQLDIEKMCHALCDEYVLFLHLHPAVKADLNITNPDFVYDFSGHYNINHVLTITDILITDYSSIPFEFALLNKPMIFFAYDLEEYANVRGFWDNYEEMVPGPIVSNTDDLIRVLQACNFDMDRVEAFADEWNQYSRGNSSANLIKAIYPDC